MKKKQSTGIMSVADLSQVNNQMSVNVRGTISRIKEMTTDHLKKDMAVLQIEDDGAQIMVMVFPEVYEECRLKLENDTRIIVHGRMSKEENGPAVIADRVTRVS
ncbi:exodeoxyribonuclease VII large subunit [Verrucomicrobiota bacterium]